ncbi:MFS transporter [Nocardioides sp. W3-2-3]|uniref:hypothetical protein n=1 Tax=Nocardioides convexus TaxID=2712224 RepID=UPI0024181A81|nr:hypothetical protein [Nocardioides convexus]NHA00753.1 MFS transporter [Nocardioides convexus]
MDPHRRGEYQGVAEVTRAMGSMWAPAAFTFLALGQGGEGWLVIAAVIVGASALTGPSLRSATRFRDQHFPATADPDPEESRSTGVNAGA